MDSKNISNKSTVLRGDDTGEIRTAVIVLNSWGIL